RAPHRTRAAGTDARGDARPRATGRGGGDRRRARRAYPGAQASGPLAGRRLYFVGIGGSGMSAYANIARAWGAEVGGWDARETIFLETLEGVDVDLGGEPRPAE